MKRNDQSIVRLAVLSIVIMAAAQTPSPTFAQLLPRPKPPDDVPKIFEKHPEAFSTAFPPELDMTGGTLVERERARLLRDRLDAVRQDVKLRSEVFQAGTARGSTDALVDALRRLTEAEVALCPKPADHVTAYDRAVKLADEFEEISAKRLKDGRIPQFDLDVIRYHRLSMQIKLLESKKAIETPGKSPEKK
jgi:hypothetical protein